MDKWWARLNDERTPLTAFSGDAKSWTRCAVGEAHRRQPLVVEYNGGPTDKKLERLGDKFFQAVRADNRPRAKQLYLMIERRVIRLMQDSL